MLTTISNDKIRLQVDNFGAEMHSLKLQDSGIEYVWQADEKYWKRHAPILFPIVGKLNNDSYTYKGKTYKLSGHGFARDSVFTLIEQKNNKLTYELKYSPDTLAVYPFKFRLLVSYEIEDTTVKIGWSVSNLDQDESMYFSIGAHPAFCCPRGGGGAFSDHEVLLETPSKDVLPRYLLNNDGVFSGETEMVNLGENHILKLDRSYFEKDAIVFKDSSIQSATLRNPINNKFVRVDFKDFPYLGIWTKPRGAEFLCIEPWFGLADSLNTRDLTSKEGIIELDPLEEFSTTYSITIG